MMRTVLATLCLLIAFLPSGANAQSDMSCNPEKNYYAERCQIVLGKMLPDLRAKSAMLLSNLERADCAARGWKDAGEVEPIMVIGRTALQSADSLRSYLESQNVRLTRNSPVGITYTELIELAEAAYRFAAKTKLDVADLALRAKCLDLADENYRFVVRTFTTDFFAADRQRAQIGIDDIRAARR